MVHIKVLFFLFGGVGGAERMTVNIGKMLPRDKYLVKFVICGCTDEISQFIPSDYEVIRIPWHNIYCFSRIRMGLVIMREHPDFVFSSTMGLNIRLLQVATLLGVKCIVRNDNMLDLASSKLQSQMKRWYSRAQFVIAQQDEMGSELINRLGLPADKVKVRYNVLDTDTINKKLEGVDNPYPKNESLKYVCINSFNYTKAQDITLKAFMKVHKQNPKTELYFVGRAPMNHPLVIEVKKMIDCNDLQDCVHIIGYDTNPYRWDKFADCYVSTSRIEGLPNVLIEAQYLGTPAVATRSIPMIDRIITDGVTGFTVAVDDVDAIANAMIDAPKLGRIKMTYKPSKANDFIELFKL